MSTLNSSITNSDEKIWRYISLAEFLGLIISKQIYFRRVDRFEDALEGLILREYYEHLFSSLDKKEKNSAIEAQEYILNKIRREHIYINCWHQNDVESYAMWKIYSFRKKELAIQSTINRLITSLNKNEVSVYKVKYLDYNDPEFNLSLFDYTMNAVTHKAKAYEYENEVRAIYRLPEKYKNTKVIGGGIIRKGILPTPSGVKIDIDLNEFIGTIYVSPYYKWFIDVVNSLLGKYGLNKEVKCSSIKLNT